MLFVAQGAAKEAVIIDPNRPPSHDALLHAWRDFVGGAQGAISFDQRPLREALPEVLSQAAGPLCSDDLVVACHACQHLARDIVDICLGAGAAFAVCPCCPKDPSGSIQGAAEALKVDFGAAMVLAEMGRIRPLCDVRLRLFDAAISPHNRVLFGRPSSAAIANLGVGASPAASSSAPAGPTLSGGNRAEEKLRSAYDRAHRTTRPHSPSSSGRTQAAVAPAAAQITIAASGGDASAAYEAQLAEKVRVVAQQLGPLTHEDAESKMDSKFLAQPGMEIRRSPPCNFRARTVVPLSGAPSQDGEVGSDSGGLFRYVPDKERGHWQFVANMDLETLLPALVEALPTMASVLSHTQVGQSVQEGLMCLKFHASLGGDPSKLLICLVYGRGFAAPGAQTLDVLREAVADALPGPRELTVLAQSRGVQISSPVGRDFVDEELVIAGTSVRYRQPFGQFSNPNPHIAIATGEWLLDVVRQEIGAGATDLLELYCGAGSHTVALAPLFRHVLAVEINRHLVEAARYNVSANELGNVTVIRAPSEEFCRRVLRRRTYTLEDGGQLNFKCTVVDPPRAGLDKVTREAVKGYEHVLYVSCNPEALRNDLQDLLFTHEVRRLVLLDHFPFSAHVETAVHLARTRV